MAFDMRLFGERLKEAFNGETQAKVGERMFTEQGTISKYVTGKQLPPLDKVYQIASLYGVSVDWLLTGKEDTPPENVNLPPPEILELAEDIYRLPVEFQKIIIGNVEDYKALCFKLEKENTQDIG